MHPRKMLSLILVRDPSPVSQKSTLLTQLQVFPQCLFLPVIPLGLHDMLKNTYVIFLSNPTSDFLALLFIGMRSLDTNFASMIIQSTIFKRSLEEGLQQAHLPPSCLPSSLSQSCVFG